MNRYRYRLQVKENTARPNILGNHSFPVHSYRWKDAAISNDLEALKAAIPGNSGFQYRIIDTENNDTEV